MTSPGWTVTLVLFRLLGTVTSSPVSTRTPSPLLKSQMFPPSSSPSLRSLLSTSTPPSSSSSVDSAGKKRCPLKISPSALVVRFGDPVTANCSVPPVGFPVLGWEVSLGTPNVSMDHFVVWSVDRMTEWSIRPLCYSLSDQGGQCSLQLDLTVYKLPDNVSISFVNDSGWMVEGQQYALQCTVQNVAPINDLTVTFYKEQEELGQIHSKNRLEKTPVNQTFTLNINSSREDDGVQYWCEAKLELGPEGPLTMTSQKLTATVYYGPQLLCPTKLQVKEGERLSCEANGNPPPVVTWIRNGTVVAPPARLHRKHAGKYIVSAKGPFGQKNLTVEVEVLTAGAETSTNRYFVFAIVFIQMTNLL
ncbi:NT-3 growth factor receptor-like [Thalassophryne amazonica]|uniref:NT-3 growth factor receptor-like n=1 Tax=Thalassophryne amazonica TaxID=390379 RepID=UPI0014714A5C|nr:NT-3 growth factor receptor-like [Thalassophryne amazonica]